LPQGTLISKTLTQIEPTLGSREEDYRQSFLSIDKRRFSQGFILWSTVAVAFVYNDYLFFGISRQFWFLVAVRLLFVASVIAFICVSNKLKKPIHCDWATLAVSLIGVAVTIYVDRTRPSSYTIVSINSLIVISTYLLLPGNLLLRGLPAFLMSIGSVFVAYHYRTGSLVSELNLLVVSLVAANALGIFVSTRLNDSRRRQFMNEATLREAKQEWERTFDTVPDLILILDNKHRVARANRTTANRLGMSLEEMVGQPCFKIIHDQDSPIPSCPHSLLLADGKEHFAEVVEERVGAVFEVSVSPLRDSRGGLLGCVHVARDITARRRAEQALKESEERYRLLVEHANDLVYRTDANGIFTFVNTAILSITGYSEEEVIGSHYLEFIQPEDRRETETFYGKQFVKSIPATYHECRLLTKKGEAIWIGQHVQLLEDINCVVEFQAIARDITDRRRAEAALLKARDELEVRVRERTAELTMLNEQLSESEARFRAIFEAAEDCVFVQDSDFKYTHVSPSMERLLGTPASEVLGLTDEVLFGEEAARYTREINSRVLLGQSVEDERTRLVKGVPTTFHEIRVPLRDRSENIIGLCGIARNITERKMFLTPAEPATAALSPSLAMRRTMDTALIAGETDSIILLTGESGSGKDYLARFIHDHSNRATGPYYTINCAALSHTLAESELFGHEAGAFTGALRRKRGLLELAEGGTLLLNEIGELPTDLQAKLLTFLDTMTFSRVGGEKPVTVSARLIAATNRKLEEEVLKGRFRQDLFYRLNVLSIKVPPLRERVEDIPILVGQIMSRLASEMRLDRLPEIDAATMVRLTRYAWPGNVRELRNVLERSLILCRGGNIRIDLGVSENDFASDWSWATTFPPRKPLNDMAGDLKRSLINEALERSNGKKTDAARLLKITRDALKRQMKTLRYSGPN
jgi:PAS domain S-box-containing protein